MERKIHNSEYSRRICVQTSITKRHEGCKRRISSGQYPLTKKINCKDKIDDYGSKIHQDSNGNTRCNSMISPTVQMADGNSIEFSKCGRAAGLKQSYNSSTSTPRCIGDNSEDTLSAELSRYKKELSECNNATRELEQKYMKINVELSAMHQRHERFLANRSRAYSEFSSKHGETKNVSDEPQHPLIQNPSCTTLGQVGLYPQISDCDFSCKRMPFQDKVLNSKSKNGCSGDNMYMETPPVTSMETDKCFSNTFNLTRLHEKIQKALSSDQKMLDENFASKDTLETQRIVTQLQIEQTHLRNVIHQQQMCLQDYHGRCLKAKCIMEAQQSEIEKLTASHEGLRKEVEKDLNKLRQQLDSKLSEIEQLSQKLKDEQIRHCKLSRENHALLERVHAFQTQAKDLKLKLEDLNKRKTILLGKVKTAERDLRVSRNSNQALKMEKSKQAEQIQKIREQLESQQLASKRALSRQRDVSDRHCRDLQRRIFELEQKLGCSNNSTSGLLMQRDRLIMELQTQVNTLVHNFELSQKHIRVLRRQIGNAAGQITNGSGNIIMRRNS